MGRQVYFYMMPEDLADLEAALKARGDVAFLAQPMPGPELREVESLAPLPGDFGGRLLARRSDLGRVRTRPVPAQGYYLMDASASPVVELSRSRLDEGTGRLSCGRMYVATAYWENGKCVDPDPEFLAWTGKVLNLVKKNKQYSIMKDPDHQGVYISDRAAQWRDRGGTLGPYGS
jgi:hypothetical protein